MKTLRQLIDIDEIAEWDTLIKYIGTHNKLSESNKCNNDGLWIFTDFPSNLNGEELYIIQLLEQDDKGHIGISNSHVYVVSKEELLRNFEYYGEAEDKGIII